MIISVIIDWFSVEKVALCIKTSWKSLYIHTVSNVTNELRANPSFPKGINHSFSKSWATREPQECADTRQFFQTQEKNFLCALISLHMWFCLMLFHKAIQSFLILYRYYLKDCMNSRDGQKIDSFMYRSPFLFVCLFFYNSLFVYLFFTESI